MLRIFMAATATLALVACGGSDSDGNKSAGRADGYAMGGMPPSPPPPPPAPAMAAPPMDVATAGVEFARERNQVTIIQQDPGGGGQPALPAGQMMAYTYGWNFSVPTGNMQDLLNAHKKLCEDAGPAKCYVTNSYINGIGEEQSNGQLSMRATEDWVRSFEKGVNDGLKPFGGSVYSNNRSAEDLTTQIVDIEARLKSQIAMRDSLQEMLRNRPGRLSDLLEIQRELANTQGNIDAQQSVVAALKLRVSMSVLTFSYQPEFTAASESIWRPLGDAFSNFAPNFAETLAGIVEFIGEVLPIVIFLAIGVWVLWALFAWMGRRRKRKTPATIAPTAKPAGGTGG